jgi:hypothetical protein
MARCRVKSNPTGLVLGKILAYAIIMAAVVASISGCSSPPSIPPKDAHAAQLASCAALPTRDSAESCIASVNLQWGFCNVNGKWVKCEP